jgi:hypothetical protein
LIAPRFDGHLAFVDTVLLVVAQIFAEEFGDNFYQIGDGFWAFTDYATICLTKEPKTVLPTRWFPLTGEEPNDQTPRSGGAARSPRLPTSVSQRRARSRQSGTVLEDATQSGIPTGTPLAR